MFKIPKKTVYGVYLSLILIAVGATITNPDDISNQFWLAILVTVGIGYVAMEIYKST